MQNAQSSSAHATDPAAAVRGRWARWVRVEVQSLACLRGSDPFAVYVVCFSRRQQRSRCHSSTWGLCGMSGLFAKVICLAALRLYDSRAYGLWKSASPNGLDRFRGAGRCLGGLRAASGSDSSCVEASSLRVCSASYLYRRRPSRCHPSTAGPSSSPWANLYIYGRTLGGVSRTAWSFCVLGPGHARRTRLARAAYRRRQSSSISVVRDDDLW